MKLRWVTVVLVVALGGGLTACGAGGANSPSAESGGMGSPTASGSSGLLGALGVQEESSPTAGSGGDAPSSPGSMSGGTDSPSAQPSTTKASAKASSSSPGSSGGSSGSVNGTSFTVPSIPGDNVVEGYGSYTKINAERVKVTICAKQTGPAFSVGALALVYNTAGATKNIGGVVLTGPGNTSCGTITFLFYSAHLRVHAFIGGNDGTIKQTGPVLDIY
jgi:hypothetical protein